MIVIKARNVHEALPVALRRLFDVGVTRDSRNGPVIVFPEPVTTVYERPLERVVFQPQRDANPFFHFAESLWMLAGRNDVSFLTSFVPRMKDFSDNGEVFHGAYGHRWRRHFAFDQLFQIINNLRKNKEDRRQVLSMWDAEADLLPTQEGRKDLPCNTAAYFSIGFDGRLDMLVTNRSNDLILGCYGANAVHFSYLQEFMAAAIGVPCGVYRQMSNNLHAYMNKDLEKVRELCSVRSTQPYETAQFGKDLTKPSELIGHAALMSSDYPNWLSDLNMFLSNGQAHPGMDVFFRRVAGPIFKAHRVFKDRNNSNRFRESIAVVSECADTAWATACILWLHRRQQKHEAAKDDGVSHE